MIKAFQKVRDWATVRGVGASADTQYQRFLQEAVEIHEAMINENDSEFVDAIGDTIVTLINLASTKGFDAEDCLDAAFNVIELRKGITTKEGDFIRYGKLNDLDKEVCDELQGNPGCEYFLRSAKLVPGYFKVSA